MDNSQLITEFEKAIPFPLRKTEYGITYAGVEASLRKPHGFQSLMEMIIKECRTGQRRYDSVINKLRKSYSLSDIECAVEILMIDGVLCMKSKNMRPRKGDIDWARQLVWLDRRAEADLPALKVKVTEADILELKHDFKEIVFETEQSPLMAHILECLNNQTLYSPEGEIICNVTAWKKYRSIVLTLAYALRLLQEGKREAIRIVSEKIWGRSKDLDAYRKDISKVAGVPLANLNLDIAPEVIFLHGKVDYQVDGYLSSCMAGIPVALTDETVKIMEVTDSGINAIFIIENLAVFQEILSRKYRNISNVLLFWGAGYISSKRTLLLRKILKIKNVPVYIWSDLDADGLTLTRDIVRKLAEYNALGMPVLMTEYQLKLTKGNFKGAQHLKLDDTELEVMFPDVLPLIKRGITMEQEELLIHYEKIEKEFPL